MQDTIRKQLLITSLRLLFIVDSVCLAWTAFVSDELGFPIWLLARAQCGSFSGILAPLYIVASFFHRLSVNGG